MKGIITPIVVGIICAMLFSFASNSQVSSKSDSVGLSVVQMK